MGAIVTTRIQLDFKSPNQRRLLNFEIASPREALSALMTGENTIAADAEGDDIVMLSWSPCNFHANGALRHPGNSQALNSGRPQLEHPLHVGNWHMAFKDHPVYNGGVARYQCAWDAEVALEGHPVAIIDHPHIATKGLLHLRRPLFAAITTRIPVHHHVTCGKRGARKQSQTQNY